MLYEFSPLQTMLCSCWWKLFDLPTKHSAKFAADPLERMWNVHIVRASGFVSSSWRISTHHHKKGVSIRRPKTDDTAARCIQWIRLNGNLIKICKHSEVRQWCEFKEEPSMKALHWGLIKSGKCNISLAVRFSGSENKARTEWSPNNHQARTTEVNWLLVSSGRSAKRRIDKK